MLKPPEPGMQASEPHDERTVGELVHQLVEDGKAYARAELGVAKAMASARANAAKLPAILFGAAFLLTIGAVCALTVGVAIALASLVGPLLGGILSFLLFAAIAAGLGWWGAKKLQEGL